ncbi:sterol desaturase family protein [Brevundimonas sp.]|uniref:sterol desaturase family protein n=1 Tax=Brevundimonas sp. TaxID=1871086 RepID=UPI002737A806|nr:sterol desaturase family protein [Brevundimonas sp.]MDP3801078.1 sterol desaturase family protein [Brevundimonas sp.]
MTAPARVPETASVTPLMRRVARRAAYPTVVAVAVLLLWALLDRGAGLAWAPYVAVAAGGAAILLLELWIPYRRSWAPTATDLADDGLYLVFVQLLVPLVLVWALTLPGQRLLAGAGLTLEVWPVAWPLWAQVLLKLAAGDLLRYWLHRWCHQVPWLWRLHAPHHQPAKLYSANVFRFHPADKALQFLADTLPFILLGVGPEVLAFYFVVYAVSGLFQHSNIDLRLGVLNYLVSGPEVHRWHHAREPEISNHNYAHTLVVWDLLFGTYYRPRDRQVGDLGLIGTDYPVRFGTQLLAPFRAPRRED